MKIALILKRLEIGGIENLLLRIANSLVSHHEVHIICSDSDGLWDKRIENLSIKLKSFFIWNFKDPLAFIKDIAEYINKESFAAIYLNDTIFGNALLPFINYNVKKISVLHALDTVSTSIAVSNSEYIDGFIAVSPRVKEILNQHELKNIFLIPNGIDITYFNAFKKENRRKNDQLNLLYCGRLSHLDKGVLFLPELLELFVDRFQIPFKLTLLGDGPDRKFLEQMLQDRKLQKNVEIKGNVSRNIVVANMKEAHFLVFPSRSEGFGLSIIEAQYMGCIPVTFNIRGVTDYIIQDQINGLICEYENIEEMFWKISRTFINKSEMKQISNAAKSNAIQFNIEKTAFEWINVTQNMFCVKKKHNEIEDRNSVLNALSLAADQGISLSKRKWLDNYYNNPNGNLAFLKNYGVKNVVIFGTKYMAFYIYADLLKNKYNTVSFIDNLNNQISFINKIPINKNLWLVENQNMYDAVIISIESNSRKKIKQNLKDIIPNKPIFIWTDFL